ncbi:MAG: DUF3592 domain-containing protein [Planctomycetaceae bacterium]|nr:DUF3592 domain-containing protein [Planctomycetaceae bacterium]
MTRLLIAVGLLTMVAGLGGAVYGVWTIWQQHHSITSAQPVAASVVGHETQELKASGFVAKVPLVRYQYTVNQQPYTSQTVTPAEFMLPDAWAESVFQQFPVGARITAHYDPNDPGKAFLIAKYSIYPYLPLLVSLVIAALGLGVVCEQLMNRDAAVMTPTTSGAFALGARQHHLTRARVLAIVGVVGLLCGAPAILHHVSVSTTPHERMGFLMEGAFAIAVLTVLVKSMLQFREGSGFGTPAVTVDRPPAIGQPVQFRLSIPTRFTGTIALKARLKCEAQDTKFFNISEEKPNTVLVNQTLLALPSELVTSDDPLTRTVNVTIPADAPPSTPVDSPERIRTVWSLVVTAERNVGQQATTEYILPVVNAGS